MIKAVTGRAVHRHRCDADDTDADDTDDNNNDNDTRRTEHDYIGSLPNEPKSQDEQVLASKGLWTLAFNDRIKKQILETPSLMTGNILRLFATF